MSNVSAEGRYKVIGVLAVGVLILALFALLQAARLAQVVGRATPYERVRTLLVRRMNVEEKAITPKADLTQLLQSGGLNRQEFVQALSEEFGLDIPEEEAASFVTVQNVTDYVARQKRSHP